MTTSEKIDRFTELRPGWHFGSGRPPTDATVLQARRVLAYLHDAGVDVTDAFCGPDGEIMVTGYPLGHYIEIDLGPESAANVRHEYADGRVIDEATISIDQLADFVSNAARGSVSETCPSLDSSTQQVGIVTGASSTTTHLRTLQEREARLSLTWNVP